MKRRKISIFVACIVAAAVVLALFGLHEQKPPVLRVVTVGQTNKTGRAALLFRVTGGGTRRLKLGPMMQLDRDDPEDPWGMLVQKPPNPEPIMVFPVNPVEFGVFAPTNSRVWGLRVHIVQESSSILYRISFKCKDWMLERKKKLPPWQSITAAWDCFVPGNAQWIESGLITNPVSYVELPH